MSSPPDAGVVVPRPDPTVLTTAALNQAIALWVLFWRIFAQAIGW